MLERIWIKGSYLSQWLPQGERGPPKESKSRWIEILHGGSQFTLWFLKIKNFQKFSDHSEIFFCFPIHKKLNKSCSLDKIFLFLKKKVVSLKKTKICRIFKTNREIFLPVHSPNLYGISIWKMHGRSHGNFFICFGDFQQQCFGCAMYWFLGCIWAIYLPKPGGDA